MVCAALASVLHVTGHPSQSHHCHPIVVFQFPLFNCHPQIAAVVFIDIVTIAVAIAIIAVAVAVAIAVAVTVTVTISAVAVAAIIVNGAS